MDKPRFFVRRNRRMGGFNIIDRQAIKPGYDGVVAHRHNYQHALSYCDQENGGVA